MTSLHVICGLGPPIKNPGYDYGSSLTLKRFFCPALGRFYYANLPKRHEIAQKFDAKLPKIYEIAQNFARNLDTLHQPGGPVPPTSYAYACHRFRMLRKHWKRDLPSSLPDETSAVRIQ